MPPEPRPTSVASGILIHPAVWPQQTLTANSGTVPLWGAGSPSKTMRPGSRSTALPSGILIHPAVCPQQIWAENWGLCPFWGGLGPHLTECGQSRAYRRTKWHLDTSSRLATTDVGRKLGAAVPLFGEGGAGSPSNRMWPGPRPTSVLSGILIHPAFGHNTWAEKWGWLCPLFFLGGELGTHI